MIFKVKSSDIEGQHPLIQVVPVILSRSRILVTILLSIITCTLFALLMKWSSKLQQFFLFVKIDEQSCTHYLYLQKVSDKQYVLFQLQYQLNHDSFQPIDFLKHQTVETKQKQLQMLINTDLNHQLRYDIYGNSRLLVPIQSLLAYLFQELTSPFYILQYFSVFLWIIEGFIMFSIVLISFSFLSCLINYFLIRKSRMQLQQLANIKQNVILIDNKIINGSELVVGDQFFIEEHLQLNCDCLLIQGDVMVNEATLTGETVLSNYLYIQK